LALTGGTLVLVALGGLEVLENLKVEFTGLTQTLGQL
jgi:hypothetical protein